jgi:hypothetical protein
MPMPLLTKTLVRADHVRSFHVRSTPPTGWEVTTRDDRRVVQQRRYTDWHRVERALARFTREIGELCGQGWREA